MSQASHFSNPNLSRIPHLIRDIHRGHLAVPRFQRPFIWTPRQRLALFESIYHGEPIGSILVWRTGVHELPCYTWHGPRADDTDGKRAAEEYVLDGHQRLTTLYSSLAAGYIASEEENPDIYERADTAPGELPEGGPVYFDLVSESFVLAPPTRQPRATWLPLSLVFDAYAMDEFRANLPTHGRRRAWYARSQKLVSRLTDYTIPVIPLVTDDLEHAIRSFHRINSQGTPMAEVHFLSALTWRPDFDLTRRLEQVRESLDEVGWSEVDLDTMVKIAKAIMGLDVYRSDNAVVHALAERPGIVDEVHRALRAVAAFLAMQLHTPTRLESLFGGHEDALWPVPIHGPRILPYKLQAVLLADGLRVMDEDLATLPEEERAVERDGRRMNLQRWLWRTSLTEHFTSMNSGQLRKTQKLVHDIARGLGGWASDEAEDDEVEIRWKTSFDIRTARSRSLSLLMAALRPQALDDTLLPAAELLAAHGNDAMMRLFGSAQLGDDKTLADSPGNRMLMEPTQARQVKRRILNEIDGISETFWHSHGFDQAALWAMRSGRWRWAIMRRNEHLRELESELAQRLHVTYKSRPPDLDEMFAQGARERAQRRLETARILGDHPSAAQMVEWFFAHYDDPVNGVPWIGSEGGYLYIYGGPHEAQDILWDYFSDAHEKELEDAVQQIEADGVEWVEVGLY